MTIEDHKPNIEAAIAEIKPIPSQIYLKIRPIVLGTVKPTVVLARSKLFLAINRKDSFIG